MLKVVHEALGKPVDPAWGLDDNLIEVYGFDSMGLATLHIWLADEFKQPNDRSFDYSQFLTPRALVDLVRGSGLPHGLG